MADPDFLNHFSGKRALVTGGFGFVGSNLVRRLVTLGTTVSVIDSMHPETGARPYNLADILEKIKFTQADVRDAEAVKSLLGRMDYLFNLAGLSNHLGSMRAPMEDLEVNALAQIQLLENCREINPNVRVVFASTRQVYGRANRLPVREEACTVPVDYNGISKLAGEQYHILSSEIHGLWTTCLRMTNTYGPRMRVKDANQNFIGLWIRHVLEGVPLIVFGSGEQTRDFNHIHDVVEAFLLSATNPTARGKIYNLGASPVRLQDLADLLISLNGSGSYTLKPFPPDRLAIDIGDYAGDFSKIHRELGWRPVTSLENGLQETLQFYRLNKAHYW